VIDTETLEVILTAIAIINAIANIIKAVQWIIKELRKIFKPGKHSKK
jgi:hypothetical protein